MCVPVVPALIAASTLVTAGGQIYAGSAKTKQARYEAKVAQNNAALARDQAADAREAGAQELQQQYRKTAQIMGAQRAALSANGVEADFGSAATVQDDARLIGWQDAQTIRRNTAATVKGYEISAANAENQGIAASARAKAQGLATAFDVGGTLLSGASQIAKAGK